MGCAFCCPKNTLTNGLKVGRKDSASLVMSQALSTGDEASILRQSWCKGGGRPSIGLWWCSRVRLEQQQLPHGGHVCLWDITAGGRPDQRPTPRPLDLEDGPGGGRREGKEQLSHYPFRERGFRQPPGSRWKRSTKPKAVFLTDKQNWQTSSWTK